MMKKRKSKNVLEDSFLEQYIGLILLSPFNIVTTVVDTLFISHGFGGSSGTYLASVALLNPVNMIFFLVSETLMQGMNTTVSREIGKDDPKRANDLIRTGVVAGLTYAVFITLMSILFTDGLVGFLGAADSASDLHKGAADYLRGFAVGIPGFMLVRLLMPLLPLDSDMKNIGIATTVMAVADIVLDALNVFVFKMGMFGMSMASSLSIYIALIFIIPHYFKKRFLLKLRSGKILWTDLKEILKAGSPTTLTNLMYTVQFFVLNRMLIYTGGEIALLANSVVSTLSELFCATNRSLGSVVHTLTGIATGEENPTAVKSVRRCSMLYGTVGNAISGLIMIALAVPLTGIFVSDSGTIAVVAVCVRLFGAALMVMSINCYIQNFFEAGRQQKRANIFVLFYSGIVPISNILIFGFATGSLTGLYISYLSTQIVMWLLMFVNVTISKKKVSFDPDDYLFLPQGFGPEPGHEMDFYIHDEKQVMLASRMAGEFVIENDGEKRVANLVSLAVEEMAMNVVRYGRAKKGELTVNVRLIKCLDGSFSLSIRDNSEYFDPVARLDKDGPAEEGLGIRMIAGISRSFEYIRAVNTNHLLIKI